MCSREQELEQYIHVIWPKERCFVTFSLFVKVWRAAFGLEGATVELWLFRRLLSKQNSHFHEKWTKCYIIQEIGTYSFFYAQILFYLLQLRKRGQIWQILLSDFWNWRWKCQAFCLWVSLFLNWRHETAGSLGRWCCCSGRMAYSKPN